MKGAIRHLSRDTLVYAISTLSNRLISFILFPFFARKFSPDDYGVIGMLTNFSFVLAAITSLGMDSAAARWYYDSDDTTHRKKVFSSWLFTQWGLLTAVALLIVPGMLLFPVGRLIQTSHPQALVAIVLVNIFLNVPAQIANLLFIVQRKPGSSVILSVASAIVSTLASLLFIFYFKWGLVGFYLGQTTGALAGLLISMLKVAKVAFTWALPQWNFIKSMLKYGISVIPANISSYFLLFISAIIIHQYTSQAELGFYQVGYTLASGIMLITGPFNQAFQPISFSLMDKPGSEGFYAGILDLYTMLLSLLCLAIGLFLKDVLLVLVTAKYAASVIVAAVLLFANYIYSFNQIAIIGMAREKKIKYFGIIVTVSNILTLTLVWLGTMWLGKEGAACGFALGNLTAIAALFAASQRTYYIPYRLPTNFLYLSGALLFLATGLWYQQSNHALHYIVSSVLLLVFALLVVWRLHKTRVLQQLTKYFG